MADPFKIAFTDPVELEELIEDYFQSRWATRTIRQRGADGSTIEFTEDYQRPPTMAGLARHLGVVRSTLWRYMKEDGKDAPMKPVIAAALNRIAEFAEEGLYTREGVTGARFTLEVNHGYGKEEDAGQGGGFIQNITPPATAIGHGAEPLAIAKWDDDDDE